MKIYNTRALTKQQRFNNALLFGIPAALGCAVILGFTQNLLPFRFEFIYLAVGYAIAYVVRTYGRGVQPRFSILSAVLCAVSLLLADAISIGGLIGIFSPTVWLFVLQSWTSFTSVFGIFGLFFRIGSIALAYQQGRIV